MECDRMNVTRFGGKHAKVSEHLGLTAPCITHASLPYGQVVTLTTRPISLSVRVKFPLLAPPYCA